MNTYFNILIKYEDQYDVLNYKDLVELKSSAGGYEVELKSPEYKNINKYFQSAVSGPLSALKEDKVRNAITEQAKMLVMLENENVF